MAQSGRKLSFFRVMFALMLLVGLGYFSYTHFIDWEQTKKLGINTPWFAAYVDVTAEPRYAFEQLGATQGKNVILSFIVSSSTDPCTPTWGNAYTIERASHALDLERRIARLRQQGGDIAISFGGLLNDELALHCTDENSLKNAYLSVIDAYEITTIDLDLEGDSLKDWEAGVRRAKVLSEIQKEKRKKKEPLAVWVTLPVIPQGLTPEGTNAVSILLENGVDLAGVNIMTMNYGESKGDTESLAEVSKLAMIETHRQLGILYSQAGIYLNRSTLWTKIGITPMIGQNDISDEVFTVSDAKILNSFAREKNIQRVSMWSANRDIQCGENYVNVKVVSDSCSGITQDKLDFIVYLSEGFTGEIEANSQAETIAEAESEPIIEEDDPESSPYPIWNEDGVYLAGTKIVWKRNVYQAKWWTQGDLPDNPVLQSWQTPWQLVGPVLPGEKPLPPITLPPGFYPEWSGSKQYNTGSRVLFEGIPYQARWWTQGDSPAAASLNPANSPWTPLTQRQVEQLLETTK
ncbi:MAG: glycosyl hydrolase family 18 [Candidatus Dojkabacteria bacterium]|nr:MAG: glycosyl hydrolase family 18 [Candidatus Dojkabacteria bacterium]